MALLRLLAIGLIGGVLAVPPLWRPRGDGFEHGALGALIGLELGQLVTVPLGFVVGLALAIAKVWTRAPGYILGTITTVFGLTVIVLAWTTVGWVDGEATGLGDTDAEFAAAFLAFFSGAGTALVGFAIVLLRWAGYDSQAFPVRRRGQAAGHSA
ncbi:hypothetical protein HII36_07055 [Nonomuraea sp. NN258]|uniref:hypothetical protein n=1 Tax=Nonomuraea antri TaxID=2730852 RepID=UPI0015686C14|nr:hypothetical protein [Nonomuraea antri]NRQ31601.1 hypothetical protein [Nonomuraea antri]